MGPFFLYFVFVSISQFSKSGSTSMLPAAAPCRQFLMGFSPEDLRFSCGTFVTVFQGTIETEQGTQSKVVKNFCVANHLVPNLSSYQEDRTSKLTGVASAPQLSKPRRKSYGMIWKKHLRKISKTWKLLQKNGNFWKHLANLLFPRLLKSGFFLESARPVLVDKKDQAPASFRKTRKTPIIET